LPFAPGSVDAIWCEGAAYIMGVPAALAAWAPLLKPSGRIALTEAVWLKPDPPERVRTNWLEYPAMTDVAACRMMIARAGLKLLGDFVLPESAWLVDYYGPLEARARQLVDKYRGDAVAQSVVAESIEEVAVYREFSAFYGYQFFVMSPR
jgi:hypothetical protein